MDKQQQPQQEPPRQKPLEQNETLKDPGAAVADYGRAGQGAQQEQRSGETANRQRSGQSDAGAETMGNP